MTTVNVYLTFNGNCEEAFNYYKSVFGGEFQSLERFGAMPPEGGKRVPPEEEKKIMHVSLPISKETFLMGSDTGGDWASNYSPGNNFSLSINTEEKKEADRLFKELSESGAAVMPMAKTFWGSYFGLLTDKFGINWMISVEDKTKK